MKFIKFLFITAVVFFALYYIGHIVGASPANELQFHSTSYDYSNCQYPDRTTNKDGKCDNTDPCDPANVKGGSGACSDAVEPKKPTSHNKKPVQKAVHCVEN